MPRTAAVVHMPVEVDVVRPHPEALLAGRQQVGWAPPTKPSEGDVPQESHVVRKWQIVAVPGPPYIYILCKHAAADTERDSQRDVACGRYRKRSGRIPNNQACSATIDTVGRGRQPASQRRPRRCAVACSSSWSARYRRNRRSHDTRGSIVHSFRASTPRWQPLH